MKKFITIALAVAVLFSFAACQQSMPTTPQEKMVVSIKTDSVPTILLGQTPSASDYVVVATRWDGETFEVPASDLDFDLKAPTAAGEGQNAGTVSYVGGYSAETQASVNLTADVCNVTAITVTGPTSPDYYYQSVINATLSDGTVATANNLFNKDLYEVVATYTDMNEETQTIELASDEYVVAYSDENTGSTTATFKLDLDKDGTESESPSATATVYIRSDAVSSWTASVADGFEAIIGGTIPSGLTTAVDVAATYVSGKVVDETSHTVALKDSSTYGSVWKTGGAALTVTFNEEEKEVSVSTINPYIVEFTPSAPVRCLIHSWVKLPT